MRRAAAALGLVCGLWTSAPAAGADATVILLSLDGLRHDLVDAPSLPAFARMRAEGVRAERLIPPFPSNTFPAHASLATGTHPDRHGILGNRFRDPERGLYAYEADADWLEAEPLWVAAERQGVRTAVFFWVGSESDWRGTGASLRKAPFDADMPDAEKVEQLLAWLDLPEPERPRLLMAWWHGIDHAAHRHTTESDAAADALREQDALLARLQAGLDAREAWPQTTLLVVSDHGMASTTRRVDAQALLAAAGIEADVVSGGGMAHVYLAEVARAQEAAAQLAEHPGVSAWPRDAMPERLRARHRRSGDVVALAEPPLSFARRGRLLERVASWLGHPLGMHGYDPRHPEMAGVFLALGRGAAPGGALGEVHAVDVAPSVAALLGIAPPAASEGRALLGDAARTAVQP